MGLCRSLCFPSLLLVLLVASTVVPAPAADRTDIAESALTCDVHGGSFVLDHNDLEVLKNATSGDGTKLTPDYIARLSVRTSKLRQQICDSRALWRSVKTKTATNDDFTTYFPNWIVDFWSEEEQKIILDYQIELAAEAWVDPQSTSAAPTAPKPAAAPPQQTPTISPAAPEAISIDTWTDPATGLMWTKQDNGSNVNWKQANQYCQSLNLGGHSNWRLPAVDELQGIYDPSLADKLKGGIRINSSAYGVWSSKEPYSAGGGTRFLATFNGQWSSDLEGSTLGGMRALCVRPPSGPQNSNIPLPQPKPQASQNVQPVTAPEQFRVRALATTKSRSHIGYFIHNAVETMDGASKIHLSCYTITGDEYGCFSLTPGEFYDVHRNEGSGNSLCGPSTLDLNAYRNGQPVTAHYCLSKDSPQANVFGEWYSCNPQTQNCELYLTAEQLGYNQYKTTLKESLSASFHHGRIYDLRYASGLKGIYWSEEMDVSSRDYQVSLTSDGECLVGNYVWKEPTAAQIQSLKDWNRKHHKTGEFDRSLIGKGENVFLCTAGGFMLEGH